MQSQALNLNIGQKQALTLTPGLLQSICMLGKTRDELEAYIEAELDNNPMLEASWLSERTLNTETSVEFDFDREKQLSDERVTADYINEDFDWALYLREKNHNDYKYGYGPLADILEDNYSSEERLADYLLEQLTKEDLSRISKDGARAYEIAAGIAEALDESGFLPSLETDRLSEAGIRKEELLTAIEVMQGLEPAGVAAADVRESLVLQYKRNGGTDPLVIEIIRGYLSDVATHSVGAVSKALKQDRQNVESCFKTISELNPKPGRGFRGGEEAHYIIPDIIIDKTEGGYEARLNDAFIPVLTVSPFYLRVLSETKKGSEEYAFLTERLNAAAAFIRSLEQRGKTIYGVVVVILKYQQAFFENGITYLKPMTRKQVADEIGVHESTVSRAVRGKYVQTPHGVIELKALFCGGVKTGDGEGATSLNVKTRIIELTAAEDKRRPLTDKALADILKDEEILLSRRTVAKYRQEAGIASSARRVYG